MRRGLAPLLLASVLVGCPSLDFRVVPSPDAEVGDSSNHHDAHPSDAMSTDGSRDAELSNDGALESTTEEAGASDASVGTCEPPYLVVGVGFPYEILLYETRTFSLCKRLSASGTLRLPTAVGMSESLGIAMLADAYASQGVDIAKDSIVIEASAPEQIERPEAVFSVQEPGTTTLRMGVSWSSRAGELNYITELQHLDEEGEAILWAGGNVTLPGAVVSVVPDPRNRTLLLANEQDSEGTIGFSPATTRRTSETFRFLGLPETYVEVGGVIDAALLVANSEMRVVVAVDEPYQSSTPRLYYSDVEATNLSPYAVCGECKVLERALIDRRADGHVLLLCNDGPSDTRKVLRQKLGASTCQVVLAEDEHLPQRIQSAAVSSP